jgi:hypothetical protein
VPGWLHNLMHEPRWRRLLLELFNESANKGSALLGYCVRELSKQGYHRSTPNIWRQYFTIDFDVYDKYYNTRCVVLFAWQGDRTRDQRVGLLSSVQ